MSSFAGIFFMALTLVLVSLSCTGLIIGNLLVLTGKGSYYGPLVGMFGFSLALALPFALFAFFPSKLNILGKAG
jgi:cytochrome c biogenesis protein CcdA